MAKKKDNNGIVWGIVAVFLGVMFLMQTLFDIEVLREIWKFWPVLLIVWGVKIIMDSRSLK